MTDQFSPKFMEALLLTSRLRFAVDRFRKPVASIDTKEMSVDAVTDQLKANIKALKRADGVLFNIAFFETDRPSWWVPMRGDVVIQWTIRTDARQMWGDVTVPTKLLLADRLHTAADHQLAILVRDPEQVFPDRFEGMSRPLVAESLVVGLSGTEPALRPSGTRTTINFSDADLSSLGLRPLQLV